MYSSSFCKVYDAFGWNYFPMYFGELLLAWMGEEKRPAGSGRQICRCLDLACGTGVLCGILQENGFDVQGMDLSADMIAEARKNYPGIPFDVADMVTYHPEGRFDLVTCTGDAVNHILAEEDLLQIFRNVYDSLEPGGYIVFDFLNRKETIPGEPFEVDYSEHIRLQLQITGEEELVHLHIRTLSDGELLFEEDIREKYYEPEWICRAVRACGFSIISCGGALDHAAGSLTEEELSALAGQESSATWILAAQKPEQEPR